MRRLLRALFAIKHFGQKPNNPHARRPRVRVRIQIGGVETTQ